MEQTPSNLPAKQIISLFDKDINLTLDPQFFMVLEKLCKSALLHSLNHSEVRLAITSLYLHLSRESLEKFGADSIDVTLLHQTLTERNLEKPRRDIDPLNILAQGKRPRLGPDLIAAALLIRRVWQGFSRFLKLSSRSYTRTGPKKRTKSLDPIMIMSTDLLNLWSEQYKPWYEQASRQKIKTKTGELTHATIALRIILDSLMPEQVDKYFGLNKGQALQVLKHQLRLFIDPLYDTPSE